ncbi:MAG TPA: hypothetical protein V6D22_11375 [Candidatus Obscuribacterales bacterium]
MRCDLGHDRCFSELAASYARLAQSTGRLERRLNFSIKANGQLSQATPGWVLPLAFAVLWGVGLFSVLEVDLLAGKLLLIGSITAASVGLDLLFANHRQ